MITVLIARTRMDISYNISLENMGSAKRLSAQVYRITPFQTVCDVVGTGLKTLSNGASEIDA